MTEIDAQTLLVAHSKSRLNGVFPRAHSHSCELLNPLCGDCIEVRIRLDEDTIDDIGFQTNGCMVCTATASILCQNARGWTTHEFETNKELFIHALISSPEFEWPENMAMFKSLSHLREDTTRRACAILPWMTISRAFIEGENLQQINYPQDNGQTRPDAQVLPLHSI